MKKKAVITVSSKQKGNEKEAIEVVTKGQFYEKENCYYAVYEETALSGMEGTTTTFKIKPDEFFLMRMGTTNAKMKFKDKDKNVSMYDTPYGTMELHIQTKKIDIDIDGNGGKVYIDYNMNLEGQESVNTLLNVDIKTL